MCRPFGALVPPFYLCASFCMSTFSCSAILYPHPSLTFTSLSSRIPSHSQPYVPLTFFLLFPPSPNWPSITVPINPYFSALLLFLNSPLPFLTTISFSLCQWGIFLLLDDSGNYGFLLTEPQVIVNSLYIYGGAHQFHSQYSWWDSS